MGCKTKAVTVRSAPLLALFIVMAGCVAPATPLAAFQAVFIDTDQELPPGNHSVINDHLQVRGTTPRTMTLEPGAVLDVRDSRIDGGPGLTVRVSGGATLLFANVTGDRVRVMMDAGASGRIENSHLLQGRGGIVVQNATLQVSNTTLESSTEEWLRVIGGNATVTDSILLHSGGRRPGIVAEESELMVTGSRLDGSSGYAVMVTGGTLRMSNDVVTNGHDYGLQAMKADVHLSGNRWETHCGAFLNGGHATVSGEIFTSLEHGLTALDGADVAIDHSRFHDDVALQSFASDLVVTNTSLDARLTTVRVDGGSVVANSNLFSGEGSVEVRDGRGAIFRGNRFEGTGAAIVGNGTLDAVGNWWGDPAGPRRGQIGPTVQFNPWLGLPPSLSLP